MSLTNAVSRRVAKIFGRQPAIKQATEKAAGRIGQDVRIAATALDADVKGLLGQAEKAFAKRRFDQSVTAYGDALAAYETPVDAQAVLGSIVRNLDEYGARFHLLPWRKAGKVAARFAGVKADAQQVVKFGDAASMIRKSEQALAAKDRKTFEEIYSYGKDLMTRIWFPYDHGGLPNAKRWAMIAKVDKSSWQLADHYASVGHGDKAAAFIASANAPTISRPGFERALREVKMYDKYGAMRDFSGNQAWELALAARNMYRFGGGKIEQTQNALFEILGLSLKHNSKAMPPETVVSWLLAHARTPDEVGSLLGRAEKLGYKVDLKRDILGTIKTPALAGVTIDGTNGGVQAVNPTALVTYAEKHGFGAEATSTLMMALQGQRSYRHMDTPHVTLGGLVADALNLGR